MVIALQGTNACMHTQKSGELSVQTIIVVSASLVELSYCSNFRVIDHRKALNALGSMYGKLLVSYT